MRPGTGIAVTLIVVLFLFGVIFALVARSYGVHLS
jgi:hypothetical protein